MGTPPPPPASGHAVRVRRFAELVARLLADDAHPDITAVTPDGACGGPRYAPVGLALHLATGGSVHLQFTAQAAPGDDGAHEPPPVHGPPAPRWPEVDLRTANGIPTALVEAYLARILSAARHPEIRTVTRFSTRGGYPAVRYGITVAFHDGSHARANVVHALPRGRQPGPHSRFRPSEMV